jgi:hypothetical protein
MGFWEGEPGRVENVSTLRDYQEGLHRGSVKAAQGAFGDVANYYRSNLGNEPGDFMAFARPELRRFREEIIPDLAEQFAGMGSGGLSSSGFRNAGINAGADLSERLGALRANLRQMSAQGLMGIGQQGLQSYTTQYQTPGSPGFLSSAIPGVLGAVGTAFGGPILGAATAGLTNAITGSSGNKTGANSDPYGSR